MSVTQWFNVNGFDSRTAKEGSSLNTSKQSVTFTGQVDPASTSVKIYTYRTAKTENGGTEVREYSQPIDKSQIKPDGTFTAFGTNDGSGEVTYQLRATNASGNTTVTEISGQVKGNDQSMQIESAGKIMAADEKGNWHSFSRDVTVKGHVEAGSKNVSVKVDRDIYQIDNIDADGNFDLTLKDLNAGQHNFTLKSTDADGNRGKDVYSISVGQNYLGGAAIIDQGENDSVHKGANGLSGNVLGHYYLEKGGKTPGVLEFTVNGKTASAGESITLEGIGSIQIDYEGGYTLSLTNKDYAGRIPDIEYTVYNGTDTDTSILSLRVNDTSGNAYTSAIKAADNSKGGGAALEGSLVNDILIGDTHNSAKTSIGEDTVVYTVKATNDRLEGNKGHDILFGDNVNTQKLGYTGSDGSDSYQAMKTYASSLLGNSGDDALITFVSSHWQNLIDDSDNGGNDIILGEAGSDIIIGGAGNDTLYGGTAPDKFVFATNSKSGNDVIKDFNFQQDRLVFTEKLNSKIASWNDETHTLSFTGVKDGQTYTNTITFADAKSGLTLEDVLKTQEVI